MLAIHKCSASRILCAFVDMSACLVQSSPKRWKKSELGSMANWMIANPDDAEETALAEDISHMHNLHASIFCAMAGVA